MNKKNKKNKMVISAIVIVILMVLYLKNNKGGKEINLLDHEVWRRENGYWFGEYTLLNSQGLVNYKVSQSDTAGEFNYRKYYGFIYIKVEGKTLQQRNIFVRPGVDLEILDTNNNGIVSVIEFENHGFTSPYPVVIDSATKTATGSYKDSSGNLVEKTFKYLEGTEQKFQANQTATDNTGNLSGPYEVFPGFSVPTNTTIFGHDTVLYQVGNGSGGLSQNQLTTLPGNGTRTRSAQGLGFSQYGSYYRETKLSKEQFFQKLQEIRALAKVPEDRQISNDWFDI